MSERRSNIPKNNTTIRCECAIVRSGYSGLHAPDYRPRRERADGLAIAAQFVGDDKPLTGETCDYRRQETPHRLIVSIGLHENIKHIAICVDRTPKPKPVPLIVITNSSICHLPVAGGQSRLMQ